MAVRSFNLAISQKNCYKKFHGLAELFGGKIHCFSAIYIQYEFLVSMRRLHKQRLLPGNVERRQRVDQVLSA